MENTLSIHQNRQTVALLDILTVQILYAMTKPLSILYLGIIHEHSILYKKVFLFLIMLKFLFQQRTTLNVYSLLFLYGKAKYPISVIQGIGRWQKNANCVYPKTQQVPLTSILWRVSCTKLNTCVYKSWKAYENRNLIPICM